MIIKKTLSITEARQNIFKLAENVQKGNHYTLVERGRPVAVMMSADEFESWQETMEVMRDFPNLKDDIKAAEEDFKHGRTISLDEILAKQGYILADKAKKSYVPSGIKSERKQGTRKNSKRAKG